MNQLLILSPLSAELEALLSRMKELGHSHHTGRVGPLVVNEFPEIGWKFSLAGHGKVQFGIQTQFFISHYKNLDAIICAGCAGGLDEQISIFDVVVANKTIEHDYRLKFAKRPDPVFEGDSNLLQNIAAVQAQNFQIHFGSIASGDEDIVDAKRAIELKRQTKALAVAWEGAGGARACKFNSVPFLEVRGITDIANNEAPVDFSANLKVAMSNACDVLVSAFV